MRLLSRGDRRFVRQSALPLLCAVLLVPFVVAPSLFATDKIWTGATNTTWGTNGNWTGNVPGLTDNAVFNATFVGSNQPTLTGIVTAGGLWMTGLIAQNVTISGGANILTLNGNTINGTGGLGILVDNTTTFTLTISCAVKIGNAQTWTNNSSNLFTVSGAVNTNTKALTVNGTGNTSISGVISSSGSVTKSGTGTLTLSGTNSYTGITTVTAGTLSINLLANGGSNGSLGAVTNAATNLVLNGGTLQYTGAAVSTDRLFSVGTSGATLDASGTGAVNFTNTGSMGFNSQTGTRTLTLTGTNTGNNTLAPIIGDNTGATTLVKNGAGMWILTGSNTFSGTTTINGGTLTLATSSGSALGSTSSVTVNSGGTLMLGASNQINDNAGITLHGGTLASGGFSEGSASVGAHGVGALTLSLAGSHLDFGTGTVGTLRFASFNPASFLLTVDNWTGTPGVVGSAGTDRLLFESDQSSNLGSFAFSGYSGAMEIALGGSLFEVVPVTTPEPSTYAAGTLALIALLGHWRKRFWKSLPPANKWPCAGKRPLKS
jgi:autotransporter-associated beta strand protein